jgi:hypothetical protein
VEPSGLQVCYPLGRRAGPDHGSGHRTLVIGPPTALPGYLRVYGLGYTGRFAVGAEWQRDPEVPVEAGHEAGFFEMAEVCEWPRPVPQSLVIGSLSNQDKRRRLISIAEQDASFLEAAQTIYTRLGFGAADGEVVLLERGMEEAIKPNLGRLGLRLAGVEIQQQFSMGPGVGRADLICLEEKSGDLVVIELKRGRSSHEVVGQVLTYVGYVKENVAAPGQQVRGWIITGDYDEGLRLAASAAGVTVKVVRLP